ncbi:conjugal transfer protein TraO [Salmonella enterica subsp. enterica serovar Typhimurium]|uniref:conjugal transfer protein TraO n=1 Tax=Salmonella enterica TaxID=28901 RepID=UPI00402A37B0
MAKEKDARRDTRKVAALAVAVIAACAGGYAGISYLMTPPPPVSHINLDRVTSSTGTPVQENPEYHALLDKYDDTHADEAMKSNNSFIASVHTAEIRDTPATVPSAPAEAVHRTHAAPVTYRRTAQTRHGLDEDRKQALDHLIKSLSDQWSPAQGGLATAMDTRQQGEGNGNAGSAGAVTTQNAFAAWTSSVSSPGGQPSLAAAAAVQKVDRMLIPAGTRTPAVVDTAVDSDNPNSKVVAHIPAGRYAGAQLIAGGAQLAGDGVSIHFTELIWNNLCYKADAWALQDDTLQSSVATDVNNRYVSRIILPAIAHGIGQVGQLYADANTQILSTDYGEVTANVDSPDAQAVTGVIVGGMADQAGQVMASDAAKLPVKQVTVNRGQTIAVLFMKPVMDSDNQTAGSPTDSTPQAARVSPANPAVSEPVTPVAYTPAGSSAGTQNSRGFPRRYNPQ